MPNLAQYREAMDRLWEKLEVYSSRGRGEQAFDNLSRRVNGVDISIQRYFRLQRDIVAAEQDGGYEAKERLPRLRSEQSDEIGGIAIRLKGVIDKCKYIEKHRHISKDELSVLAERLWHIGEVLSDMGVPLSEHLPVGRQKYYRFESDEYDAPLYRHEDLTRKDDLQPSHNGFFNDLKPLMGVKERGR